MTTSWYRQGAPPAREAFTPGAAMLLHSRQARDRERAKACYLSLPSGCSKLIPECLPGRFSFRTTRLTALDLPECYCHLEFGDSERNHWLQWSHQLVCRSAIHNCFKYSTSQKRLRFSRPHRWLRSPAHVT